MYIYILESFSSNDSTNLPGFLAAVTSLGIKCPRIGLIFEGVHKGRSGRAQDARDSHFACAFV